MATLAIKTDNGFLVPADAGKNAAHRIGKFVDWLDDNGATWRRPDLASYRDYLLSEGYATSSVSAHLSTVRGQYKRLLASNATRDKLYQIAASQADNVTDRKTFVDEVLTRLANDINPLHSAVATETKQDRTAAEETRLTIPQAEALIRKPGTDDIEGIRDTALIALALATGLREAELANLDIDDLRSYASDNTTLGVYVREGKMCKSRFVPYGDNEQVLELVDKWTTAAGITEGRVFRAFYRGGSVRESITARAIQDIFKKYPVMVNGQPTHIRPHDARRSYARICYDAGMDIVAIQQNLGHSNIETTLGYIGALDMDKRKPTAAIRFV